MKELRGKFTDSATLSPSDEATRKSGPQEKIDKAETEIENGQAYVGEVMPTPRPLNVPEQGRPRVEDSRGEPQPRRKKDDGH